MTTTQPQVIVVSNDKTIIHACRKAATRAGLGGRLRRIHRPERLPNVIGISDWLLIDADNQDLNTPEWVEKLAGLSGQIIAVGGGNHRLSEDYESLRVQRFLHKNDLENQLSQLMGESVPLACGTIAERDELIPFGQEKVALARSLAGFAERLASLDVHQIVKVCLEEIAPWTEARLASLYRYDEQGDCLVLLGQTHPYSIDAQLELGRHARYPMIRALAQRQVVVTHHWEPDAAVLGADILLSGRDYQTEQCIIAPLICNDELIGVLNLTDPMGQSGFRSEHVELIEPLRRLIALGLRNASVFQMVQHEARTDSLTGLANRRAFTERLNLELLRARRYDLPMSLAMIDLDGLKQINDAFGHPAGDSILREVAQRIRYAIREIDLPARCGGDEFAVLLPNTPKEQAQRVARRLAAVMAQRPCHWQGNDIPITVSIGLAPYEGQVGASDLISAADSSLYLAKSRGKNCVAFIPA